MIVNDFSKLRERGYNKCLTTCDFDDLVIWDMCRSNFTPNYNIDITITCLQNTSLASEIVIGK